jgi:acyl-CoA thioesterase-1
MRLQVGCRVTAKSACRASLRVAVVLAVVMAAAPPHAEERRCARAENSAMPDIKALPRLARKIASGESIRIVAFGSSSTEGTPDIPRDAIFPAVLGRELARELLTPVEVINKGKGGENIYNMVARIERDVVSQRPDLVVWQLGANDVLQMDGVAGPIAQMQVALDAFGKLGMPVVLVDLQAAPMMDKDKDTPVMQAAIEQAGTRTGVLHFHRQALMKRLIETHTVEMPELVGQDGLHMTALGHFCTGQLLARQIARASFMRRAEIQR